MTETLTRTSLGGLRIQKIKDTPPFFNMMVYGDAGVGKTYLAATADDVPAMRKVLFIDLEGGLLTLRGRYSHVDTVRVTSWKEVQSVYDELLAGGHDYNTVVIDSLTEAQKMSMSDIMKLIGDDPGRDPDVASMREWGKNLEQTRRFVRAFRDLPMNTIFTCLSVNDKNSMTGRIERRPYLTGKLSSEIAAFLDEVFYLYPKEVEENGERISKRMLLTAAQEGIVSKDRSGNLPLVVENPDMKDLYVKITEGDNK